MVRTCIVSACIRKEFSPVNGGELAVGPVTGAGSGGGMGHRICGKETDRFVGMRGFGSRESIRFGGETRETCP